MAPHECNECDRLARDFSTYSFDEVPPNVVEYHGDSLPLFGPVALRHYLPTYLLYSLYHPGSDVLEFTVLHLTPSAESRAESGDYFEQGFGPLSEAQRLAVAAFLEDVVSYQWYTFDEHEFKRAAKLWPLERLKGLG